MIYLNDLRLSFGDKVLFDGINWTIHEKSRVGLVGDNGTGKTTLLRAILGDLWLESGSVEIPNRRNRVIGYLPQDLVELPDVELLAYLRNRSGIAEMERDIRRLEMQVSETGPADPLHAEAMKEYERVAARFQAADGYAFEARAKQILSGFGFRERDFEKRCTDFSGGWKMRIQLSLILLSRPDVMLLDEPTNHLDTESMEWLESYLRDYPGTLIAIAHDRFFLDKMVNTIAELAGGRITIYRGNYSRYLEEKDRRRDLLLKEMEVQKAEIKRIEAFVERFRYKATKASQVQSRLKMLEKFSAVRQESNGKTIRMRFPEAAKSGREVVVLSKAAQRYGDFTVFRDVDLTCWRGEKIALVGLNGSGKSTLSRLLSGTEAPAEGTVRFGLNVKTAFFSQESAENLDYSRTVWQEANAPGTRGDDQQRRNLLGAFLFSGDDIFKPVSVLSGGEKSRLALLKILLTDSNFLILDEPTNHLDLKTKEIFQEALLAYNGTVVLVSHDRFFLDRMVNRVLEIHGGRIRDWRGNYSWFIEKRRADADGAAEMRPSEDESPERAARKSKEERRREAEERNRLSRTRQARQREFAALERRIEELEKEKSSCELSLCDPEVLRNAEAARTLKRKLAGIEIELAEGNRRWERLAEELGASGELGREDRPAES